MPTHTLPRLLLALLLTLGAGAARAQGDVPAVTSAKPATTREVATVDLTQPGPAAAAPAPAAPAPRLTIGAATDQLLDLQRASRGERPRPIDGEQARRSYQRYLKSFEREIPERFDSGMDVAR